MTQENNWCLDFFDDLFAEHHLVRNDQKELDETISFLEQKLHLQPEHLIFDQCCGVGSLSIALAKKGYRVHGMDLIPSYIARAKQDAAHHLQQCTFAAGDAHDYITPAPCDAAISWWTSFGYTPDDAQNARMLQRVHDSLKPGAWFTLDYMNAPQRLASLQSNKVSYRDIPKEGGTITWETRLDSAQNMIVKKWSYTRADGTKVEKQGGGAKVYTRDDLSRMFEHCGFTDLAFYGNIMGDPLNAESARCIVVARKKTS